MSTITQVISSIAPAADPYTMDIPTFSSTAAQNVTDIVDMITEINTWAGQVNTVKGEMVTHAADTAADAIATAADAVSTAADAVSTAADAAAASASAASAAAIAGAFVGTSATSWTPAIETKAFTTQTGEQYTAGIFVSVVSAGAPTAWGIGQVDSYVTGTGVLTVSMQVINGSGAHTDWNISLTGTPGAQGNPGVDGASTLVRSARTSNTILGTADKSTLIDITSGTFTQTFTAAATLTDGWWCYIRNSGTGDITLDPNASEQIDGLTSFIMYPGECRIVQCTGTAFNSVVVNAFHRSFLTTGTFTKPPGYKKFAGLLWGAGGSGGCSNSGTYYGAGGGGGTCVPFELAEAIISASETVTIGAGGVAKTGATLTGSDGGNSTFGTLVTAYGGGGGGASAAANRNGGTGGGALGPGVTGTTGTDAGGAPGTGTSSDSGFGGASSVSLGPNHSAYGGASGGGGANVGGSSLYGGGGGSSNSAASGGTSVFGGDGSFANYAGVASAGAQPGGGGGGTQTGTSGPGGDGECDIWGVI